MKATEICEKNQMIHLKARFGDRRSLRDLAVDRHNFGNGNLVGSCLGCLRLRLVISCIVAFADIVLIAMIANGLVAIVVVLLVVTLIILIVAWITILIVVSWISRIEARKDEEAIRFDETFRFISTWIDSLFFQLYIPLSNSSRNLLRTAVEWVAKSLAVQFAFNSPISAVDLPLWALNSLAWNIVKERLVLVIASFVMLVGFLVSTSLIPRVVFLLDFAIYLRKRKAESQLMALMTIPDPQSTLGGQSRRILKIITKGC